DARPPVDRPADLVHCPGGCRFIRLRVRDAVRHPGPAPTSSGCKRTTAARPDLVRRTVVSLVHAPAGGTACEYDVRRAESVRRMKATQFLSSCSSFFVVTGVRGRQKHGCNEDALLV